jgi:two-component system, OmpR family, sensor kinase
VAFVAANVVVIALVPTATTIPFHNIWVSLTLLYGFRLWPLGATVPLLVAVCAGSAAALTVSVLQHDLTLGELAEVPMMGTMFMAMVWHARRQQASLEELQRSAAGERDFVRDASHQLRTPITVARGHIELLRGAMSAPDAVEDVEVVVGELERLSLISDRLLMLVTAEHVGFARTPVDLASLLVLAARRWEPAAPRDWRVELEAHGTVEGDAGRLESALDAVIENAVKATQPGDRIALALRAEGGDAVIEISDEGVGIPPEHLTRVFDRFWSASRDGPAAASGTGLGLAAVKSIAEAHGGQVEALRAAEGGAAVRITLSGFTLRPSAAADDRAVALREEAAP